MRSSPGEAPADRSAGVTALLDAVAVLAEADVSEPRSGPVGRGAAAWPACARPRRSYSAGWPTAPGRRRGRGRVLSTTAWVRGRLQLDGGRAGRWCAPAPGWTSGSRPRPPWRRGRSRSNTRPRSSTPPPSWASGAHRRGGEGAGRLRPRPPAGRAAPLIRHQAGPARRRRAAERQVGSPGPVADRVPHV